MELLLIVQQFKTNSTDQAEYILLVTLSGRGRALTAVNQFRPSAVLYEMKLLRIALDIVHGT